MIRNYQNNFRNQKNAMEHQNLHECTTENISTKVEKVLEKYNRIWEKLNSELYKGMSLYIIKNI